MSSHSELTWYNSIVRLWGLQTKCTRALTFDCVRQDETYIDLRSPHKQKF